jgi:hypothetical protein
MLGAYPHIFLYKLRENYDQEKKAELKSGYFPKSSGKCDKAFIIINFMNTYCFSLCKARE